MKTLTLKIEQDQDPVSPREWDNLGVIAAWHGRYHLDEAKMSQEEFLENVKDNPDCICLPLYMYDHSGLAFSTSPFGCRWDSGQVGWVYTNRERCTKYGVDFNDKTRVETCLKGEVDTYDQYQRGDIYGYIIEDADGEHVDSCWGFYGEEDARLEGEGALKREIEEARKRHEKATADLEAAYAGL